MMESPARLSADRKFIWNEGSFADQRGSVIVLEAPEAGSGRERWLRGLAEGDDRFFLDVDFETGGLWAGLRSLFGEIFHQLEPSHEQLVHRHSAALAYVLPELKSRLGVINRSLTDLVPDDEKVRAYPADRAYRVVHDLIDLLASYKSLAAQERPWYFICDRFDRIGHIGRRFFVELVRRRGSSINLHFLLAVDPGNGRTAGELFPQAEVRRIELPEAPRDEVDRDALLAEAAAIEARIGDSRERIEIHVADLLRIYSSTKSSAKILYWKCRALEVYNLLGFYEDSLTYGNAAWRQVDFRKLEPQLAWILFLKMFSSNIGLQRVEEALGLVEESGVLDRQDFSWYHRAQLYYLIAMVHVRYLKPRDLARGEELLQLGLEVIDAARSRIADHDYYFLVVFNRNGLALIRHFQGRFAEAIELCEQGYRQLESWVPGEKHKLHRSVLLYNIGQVFSGMGDAHRAIDYYSRSIAMDPFYSEYFNERAALYLRTGDYAAALADFRRAIELSPPYTEVWVNLGQCHRKLGNQELAIEAYSRALDLEPSNSLALVGRGQIFDALERIDEAFADYSRALEISPEQWDVHTSRAVLHYQRGDLAASLADLDRAIALAPEQPDPYLNRSVALEELSRIEEAAADLRSYLRLAPQAPDRAEAEQRLRGMTIAA